MCMGNTGRLQRAGLQIEASGRRCGPHPMIAMFRLALVILVVEAVFYVLLFTYLRSTKAEKLEHEWTRRHPDQPQDTPQRQEFLRRALSAFSRRIRPRLAWFVMVLPMVAIMTIIFFVNYR